MKHADKIKHFIAGVIVAIITAALIAGFTDSTEVAKAAWAVAMAGVAGVNKELYDGVSGNGVVHIWDAIATIAGGLIVAAVILLV